MDTVEQQKLDYIPLDEIVCDRINVRKTDIETNIDDLVESIKSIGLLQPVIQPKSPEHRT